VSRVSHRYGDSQMLPLPCRRARRRLEPHYRHLVIPVWHSRCDSLRPPRIPSVGPIVLGVCAAIVALMVIFVAIFAYTVSSRQVDAAAALFMRHVALVMSVLSLVPVVASILFFVRYQRTQKAFNLGLQRFEDERNQGQYS
jgi:hypothetical protein